MKIYTGSPGGSASKMAEMRKRNIGIMLSSEFNKSYKEFSCALDNGAFEAWRRGFPFSENRFLANIEKAWSAGLKLDFIVVPDIVAGGSDSLKKSLFWVDKLRPATLALAVQDGMSVSNIGLDAYRHFNMIFVGGSVAWKWETAHQWVEFAHSKKMKCHIGRCGTLERLRYARKIGADSVDSTSFVRNDSWEILDEFADNKQLELQFV